MTTAPPMDPTPRVLIVENEVFTIGNLTRKLERDIPGVIIATAETGAEGRARLAHAFAEERPFDVAILDLRLPKDGQDPGEAPDYQLPSLFPAKDGLIVHMTAKADDVVFSRARPDPESPEAKRHVYVEKVDYPNESWAQKVVDAAARFIREKHVRRIRSEFERLFRNRETSESEPPPSIRLSTGRGDRDLGLEIARFCDDAGDHWELLDEEFRKKLADALGHMQDTDGRHYVGVAAESAPETTEGGKP